MIVTDAVAQGTFRARERALASRLTPHLVLFAVLVLWSGNAVVVKVGLENVHPVSFTAARFLIGAILVGAAAQVRGHDLRRLPPLRHIVPAALAGIVANQLSFSFGVHLSTAVDVSLIMSLSPIMAAIVLFLTAGKRPSARQLTALALGFAGLIVVVLEGSRGGDRGSLAGDLIALGAPTSWAVYLVIAARAARKVPATVFMTWVMLLSLVVLLPLAFADGLRGGNDWSRSLLPLAYAGVIATALGYLAYFWALPRLGVVGTSIYTYLQPAIGALAGALFLGETLGLMRTMGAVAILAAAYLGSSRGWTPSGRARRSLSSLLHRAWLRG